MIHIGATITERFCKFICDSFVFGVTGSLGLIVQRYSNYKLSSRTQVIEVMCEDAGATGHLIVINGGRWNYYKKDYWIVCCADVIKVNFRWYLQVSSNKSQSRLQIKTNASFCWWSLCKASMIIWSILCLFHLFLRFDIVHPYHKLDSGRRGP